MDTGASDIYYFEFRVLYGASIQLSEPQYYEYLDNPLPSLNSMYAPLPVLWITLL